MSDLIDNEKNALDIMNTLCSESGFKVYSPRYSKNTKANTCVILDELNIDKKASEEYLKDLGADIENNGRKRLGKSRDVCELFVDIEYTGRWEVCIKFFAHIVDSEKSPDIIDLTDGRVYLC